MKMPDVGLGNSNGPSDNFDQNEEPPEPTAQPLQQSQQQQLHYHQVPPHSRLPTSTRAPPIDIYDTPDSFRINVALPGVPPECISIDYQYPCHELIIKGQVPHEIPFEPANSGLGEEKYNKDYLRVNECWPLGTEFSRRIKFPQSSRVDGSKVTADLKYGVVYINVPKLPN